MPFGTFAIPVIFITPECLCQLGHLPLFLFLFIQEAVAFRNICPLRHLPLLWFIFALEGLDSHLFHLMVILVVSAASEVVSLAWSQHPWQCSYWIWILKAAWIIWSQPWAISVESVKIVHFPDPSKITIHLFLPYKASYFSFSQRNDVVANSRYADLDTLHDEMRQLPTDLRGEVCDVNNRPEGWNE